jgi:CHASE3 domain sensor protein
MKKSILLSILFILSLGSCTIEKRKYSSGYHTTWNVQHLFPKGNSANLFQKEESKLSFSPKLNSQNDNALRPISSDSIQKQESVKQTELSLDSKHKKQRLTNSVSDTVPKVKKKEQELPSTIQLKDQLLIDKKLVARSWLVLLISAVTFIGSIAMLLRTDSEFAFVLLTLGGLGGTVSIILIIAFTLLKNKHKNQIKLNQKRHEPGPAISENEKKLLQKRLDKLTRKIRSNKILLVISAIVALMLSLLLVTLGYSEAVVGALEIFILLALLFISLNIIQRKKKNKIEDRLNTTS